MSKEHKKLGQLDSTSLCINDILSSFLYVAMLAAMYAGCFAPFILAFIGLVLYLYRKVYTESVEALPANGGCYNLLLNTTFKNVAAMAGVFTFLSYVATGDVSAKVGVEYLFKGAPFLEHIFHGMSFPGLSPAVVPVFLGTSIVFAVFCFISWLGVKDSATAAKCIWAFNKTTILIFVIAGCYHLMNGGHNYWSQNWNFTMRMVNESFGTEIANVVVSAEETIPITAKGNILIALFFGFAVSLLGVSGYESSANFREEQEKGVFTKTLRNMQLAVTIVNTLVAFVCLTALPIEELVRGKDFMLADVATTIGGKPLMYLVCVDAFLVLCGAVLTSFVGVSGLMSRMAEDGCIPRWFAYKNERGSFPRILVTFLLVAISILWITNCDLLPIAGVYTISFLSVMTLFAIGTLLLKSQRANLKKEFSYHWMYAVIAGLCTLAGLIGNILIDPRNPMFFAIYFVPFMLFVLATIYHDVWLRAVVTVLKSHSLTLHWGEQIEEKYSAAVHGIFMGFVRSHSKVGAMMTNLCKNEPGMKELRLVVCADHGHSAMSEVETISEAITKIQALGFFQKVKVTVQYCETPFNPETVLQLSEVNNIPTARMAMGSIELKHIWDFLQFRGVRIVMT